MSGNRISPDMLAEPLRAVLDAAREVAAAGTPRAWDDLDVAAVELVRFCRSAGPVVLVDA